MQYKFSVSKIKLKQIGVIKKEINTVASTTINWQSNTQKEYDTNGVAQDEFKLTEDLTITIAYLTDVNFDTTLIKGELYDIVFEAGVSGGGIAATLANCKLVGFAQRGVQDAFNTTTLTFHKLDEIDSSLYDAVIKQRVKFGSIYLGDSAFVIPEYQGNVHPLIVPTALGLLVRSTNDLGGGQLNIKVNGYIKKNTRLELEQHLINLYGLLETGSETLTIEYGASSYTITNCYWINGRPDSNKNNFTHFEMDFVKSAY